MPVFQRYWPALEYKIEKMQRCGYEVGSASCKAEVRLVKQMCHLRSKIRFQRLSYDSTFRIILLCHHLSITCFLNFNFGNTSCLRAYVDSRYSYVLSHVPQCEYLAQ
jgi:hypothetical protein